MKTPRELLLEHHRKAQPRLDTMRREALATLNATKAGSAPARLGDFLRSLRWHLAAMSVIWLFILVLHLDTARPPVMAASVIRSKIPPPQVIMAALRENRRQLSEMIEPHTSDAEPREFSVPKPRSQAPVEMIIA